MRRLAILTLALAACLAFFATPASANRALLSEALLQSTTSPQPLPPPEGELEGACGLAVSGSTLYVSDYYHRAVDAFSTAGTYSSQIALAGGPFPAFGINTLDSVCGLATGPGGALYGNEYHEGALRLAPSEQTFDTAESTGVATDAAGNLYVDDRSHVAVYQPSGEAVLREDPVSHEQVPLVIGADARADYYGLAVAPDGSRVYLPDAATGKVEVFEPSGDPSVALASIAPPGGFTSLADSSLALDPTNGHLIVVDDAQPGFEHPGAAVYEFGAPPTYPYLGKLACAPVFGAPSGIALDSSGDLYVTDGNGEGSNVFKYGPYTSGAVPTPACGAGGSFAAPFAGSASPAPEPSATAPAPSAAGATRTVSPQRTGSGARAPRRGKGRTLVQKGPIRVAVTGGLAPTRLPRTGAAPISVTIGGEVSTTDPASPPQLRKVSFAFNRAGRLNTRGLPRCALSDIDPSSTSQALAACRDALVGEGRFAAAVRLPEQSPFPSAGKVLAFNGILGCHAFSSVTGRAWSSRSRTQGGRRGERTLVRDPKPADRGRRDAPCHARPVVFAHIYGTKPVPTSIVLPLAVRHAKGRFATLLEASLADLTGEWGYVRSIDLRLGRTYRWRGRRHSFLSAACPAPKGFPGAVFPLARAGFGFLGGKTLTATVTRSCKVRK
jgi:hypothetical protein